MTTNYLFHQNNIHYIYRSNDANMKNENETLKVKKMDRINFHD